MVGSGCPSGASGRRRGADGAGPHRRRDRHTREARGRRAVLRARRADRPRPQVAARRRARRARRRRRAGAAGRRSSACSGRPSASRPCSRGCSSSAARGRSSSRSTRRSRALEGRTDLRDLTTFTIDPDTAKDFDDAISVRREGDGVRAWVHIADVSYFVDGRLAARPRRGRPRVLDVRPGPRRADAPAGALGRPVLAAAARRSPDASPSSSRRAAASRASTAR